MGDNTLVIRIEEDAAGAPVGVPVPPAAPAPGQSAGYQPRAMVGPPDQIGQLDAAALAKAVPDSFLRAFHENAQKAIQAGFMTDPADPAGMIDLHRMAAYKQIFAEQGYALGDPTHDPRAGLVHFPVTPAETAPPPPARVELTKENADLVAQALKGKIGPEEFEAELRKIQNTPLAPTPFAVPPPSQPQAAAGPGGGDGLSGLLGLIPGGRQMAGLLGGGQSLAGVLNGAAGGGLSGLAGAAGPLAAAYFAADYAAGKVADGFNTLADDVRVAGGALRGLARNDLMPAIEGAMEKYADFWEKNVPIEGQVIAAEVRFLGTAFREANAVVKAFVDRGRELANVNPSLAAATATADVRKALADIREADRTGPGIARLIDAQSRLEVAIQDGLAPLKGRIADKLADMVERVALLAQIAERQMVAIDRVLMAEDRAEQILRQLSGIDDVIQYARQWLQQQNLIAQDEKGAPLDRLIQDAIDAIPRPGTDGIKAREEAARQKLGRPLIAR